VDPLARLPIGQTKSDSQTIRPHLGILLMLKTSHSPYLCHITDISPPSSCLVNLNRDCGSGGCVISAIGNNSQILRNCLANSDVSISCSNALKFIVHFFGDVTQPLHCSSYERGGNQIEVKCKNRRRNLHSVPSLLFVINLLCWDTDISELLEDQLGGFDGWPDELKSQIDASPNKFLTPPTDWVSCVDPDNIEECALKWAKESNAFTCSYVYPYPDGDICGDYAQGAFPIIETQIAKGILPRMHAYSNCSRIEAWSLFKFGCYRAAWMGRKWKLRFQHSVVEDS
jgi:hypothetical protein